MGSAVSRICPKQYTVLPMFTLQIHPTRAHIHLYINNSSVLYIYIYIYIKVDDHSQGQPKGSIFISYLTEVLERALLLSLDCSTSPLIPTLLCWVLSKEASSTIFWVFVMNRPRVEPRSPKPLENTLPPLYIYIYIYIYIYENWIMYLIIELCFI